MVPFEGHVVADEGAHGVVAPPYDALSPAQRRALAAADPNSFLNVLPPAGPEASADLEHTLAACRRNLDRLIADGLYVPLPAPVLAVVALGEAPDRSVGIVGDLPVEAFSDGRVLPHERIRDDRVDQLRRYLEVVGVASSPVAVTHRPHPAVAAVTAPILQRDAVVAFRGDDGVDVALWLVTDPGEQAELAAALDAAGTLYVADGHHRAAAVLAFADRQGATSATPAGRVLTAAIPCDQLHVLPFHRLLREVGHLGLAEVVRRLDAHGMSAHAVDGPTAPSTPGTVVLTAEGRWLTVDLRDRVVDDEIEGLDVRLVERELLPALLGDPAAAPSAGAPTAGASGASGADASVAAQVAARPRVETVAAPAGLGALSRPDAVGIALAPPDVEAILRVSDRGATMPPKTTYVAPKLRSGLLVTPRRS
jgi:uncharacterized protein (DUF1015 family)